MSGFFQLFKISMILVGLIMLAQCSVMFVGQLQKDNTPACQEYRAQYHQAHC